MARMKDVGPEGARDVDPEQQMGAAGDGDARDRIFATQRENVLDFRFDSKTASVFDDMVGRSVPYYDEIQRMISELASDFAVQHSRLYDLGCSTGTTLQVLDQVIDPSVQFVGIDNSPKMLDRAREKLAGVAERRNLELLDIDLNDDFEMADASVATMVLTLQFIRPLQREKLVRRITSGLREQGCLILVEKLTSQDSLLNRLFINHYYELKRRNGYSEIEIAQKREALENVLIPYRFDENRALLLENGFRHVEQFFRWYNFAAMIAIK